MFLPPHGYARAASTTPRRRDPQRGHFKESVFLVDTFHPCRYQTALHERNQDISRNIVGDQHRFGAAVRVGSDDLQRAMPDVSSRLATGPLHPLSSS